MRVLAPTTKLTLAPASAVPVMALVASLKLMRLSVAMSLTTGALAWVSSVRVMSRVSDSLPAASL